MSSEKYQQSDWEPSETILPEYKGIAEAIQLIDEVLLICTGLNDFQRRLVGYFAVSTYYISQYSVFPGFMPYGSTSSGKSQILDVLYATCSKPSRLTEKTSSEAALRAAMKESNGGTLILEEAGMYGKLAKEKEIPDEVFQYDEETLALFISRIFACDGYVPIDKKRKPSNENPGITLATKKAIWQIKELLFKFGIKSKIRYKPSKYTGNDKIFDAWELTIPYYNDIVVFAHKIGMFIKQDKLLSSIENKEKRCKYFKQKDIFYAYKIKSIEYIGEEMTYDVEIPGYHNFMPNYIISHNTAWAQSFLPYKMANPVKRREQVRIFAPTDNQLFVMDDIHESIQRSDFLMDEFVMLRNPIKKMEGKTQRKLLYSQPREQYEKHLIL